MFKIFKPDSPYAGQPHCWELGNHSGMNTSLGNK